MKRTTKAVLSIIAVSLLLGFGLLIHATVKTVREMAPNAYAVWWTVDLVIEHMEKNDGRWPRNWEDLRTTSERAYKGNVSTNSDGTWIAEVRPRASIEELRKRVEIDWLADPNRLVKRKFTRRDVRLK
jgi:hypothetical protein